MNSVPRVSIVIPAFNPRFFQAALASALSQTYANLEVIVCDDSPDSQIQDIVQLFGMRSDIALRYVRNAERLGLVGNLRAGLEEAQGEFIKFLCDDDLIFPTCIAQQAQALQDNADCHFALAQRLFWDANDLLLPGRLENSPLSQESGVFKGDDLLAIIESFPVNFLGGFSSALFRRADLVELLPALTQPGFCFTATLDFALYICLLRRGNLVVLNNILSVERLYPERLIRQQPMLDATQAERKWLVQMLEARSGESAPAAGWVSFVALSQTAQVPRVWGELPLSRTLGNKQAALPYRVGVESQSFGQMYAQWLACRTLTAPQKKLLPDTLAGWHWRPKIVPVVIDDQVGSAALELTLRSISQQLYTPELVLVLSSACTEMQIEGQVLRMPLQRNWQQQLNELLGQLDGADWIYLLQAGDRLPEPALLVMAERIVAFADIRCIYSDEGGLVDGESAEPAFKPDFNVDMLRSFPYVGRALAFERQGLLNVGGFDSDYGVLAAHDLLWRLVEAHGSQAIEHIAQVLVESQSGFAQWLGTPEVIAQNPVVVQAHLQRMGIAHEIRAGSYELLNRVDYVHAERPLVSIIIASQDHLAAVQRCVQSLLEKTAYGEYELLLINNGSQQTASVEWFAAMSQMGSDRLRVLNYPQQGNIAALRNFAAGQARGEFVLMLSPFAVITEPLWLDELLNHGQRAEVAVVGAKVLSPDGAVVHAGLILGLQGPVGVPFYGEMLSAAGYMHRLQVVQDLSAVGPDCLLLRKQVFDELGGFDEQNFAHALSEVDLCLRIRQSGYLVVWTPYSQLVLGAQPTPAPDAQRDRLREQEQENYYKRWLPLIVRDPAYNPNLALHILGGSSFSLEPGLLTGWSPFSHKQLPSILALPVNTSAVGHYRVTQPLLELEAAGRAIGQIHYDQPSLIEIERLQPDVIVTQCRYSEPAINDIEVFKKYFNARRIYELDDYVIKAPKKNSHIRNMPDSVEMERLVRRGIGLCDRVVVSTAALADALSGMHQDIRVVPNMLAPHLWNNLPGSRRRASSKPRVGWGGGTSHHGDLAIIADVVRELADVVEWVFFGMCPDELRPYLHEFHPAVGLDAYPARLASLNLDLALAPLEFHIFNECKSNLRLLEYGACGYPVICTDTAAYRGYLPCTRVVSNSTSEWLEAIHMHLDDPDASYRMGDQLREAVMRDYMLQGDNLRNWEHGWLDD